MKNIPWKQIQQLIEFAHDAVEIARSPVRIFLRTYQNRFEGTKLELIRYVSVKVKVRILKQEDFPDSKAYSSLNRLAKNLSSVFLEVSKEAVELNFHNTQVSFKDIYSLIVNSGLMKAVNSVIAKSVESKRRDDVVRNTIVGMLVLSKSKKIASSYASYFFTAAAYIAFSKIMDATIEPIVIVVVTLLIACTFINQQSLKYRIRKGLYGNNRYEATEIIEYIQENFKNDDFTDGSGGLKEIYPEAEVESKTSKATSGSMGGLPV